MLLEPDLRYLQLVEMSDSLPPLSKFNTGFKLDDWQKRVLRWIDAGRRCIITISNYVGIVFQLQFDPHLIFIFLQ